MLADSRLRKQYFIFNNFILLASSRPACPDFFSDQEDDISLLDVVAADNHILTHTACNYRKEIPSI